MKTYIVVGLLMLVGCAAPQASKSPAQTMQTTARGRNINDVSRDIQGWHNAQHSDCKYVRVIGAKVVEKKADSVVEHWTIEACNGQQFTYEVLILLSNDAFTDMVSNVDHSPVATNHH